MRRSLRLALLLSAAPLALPVMAQDTVYLDAVTIIGTGLPTDVLTNPASVTVIEGRDLEGRVPVSVTALLRDVPGLQISEEGIERVALRGEDSRRVAILIDGQRLTDHTNYGQPILVDPSTIERIEVVRGASSVVSGSRAIGGVINIVTKAGADTPFSLSASAGYLSASEGYRASVTAAGTVQAGAGALDYRLSYGRMSQGDRHTPDGVLANSSTSDRNLSLHLGYRLGDHYVGLRAQRYDLAAKVYTGSDDFLIDLPHRDLRKISLFYEGTNLTPWMERLSADVYRQTIDRLFENDITTAAGPGRTMRILSDSDDRQETVGANLRAEMQFWQGTRTVAGLEYEDDRLVTDKSSTISMAGMPGTTTLRHDDASIRTISVFAQHEVELPGHLTATFGGRWYRVKASHDASTTNGVANPTSSNSDSLGMGSVGLVWAPDDSFALRANLSQGYIYPTLGQLFLTTTGGGATVTGNPDLKPERATTLELGARLSRGAALVDATLFYTEAKDYIAYTPTGPRLATYANVDAAKSWGLELRAEYASDVWGLTPYVTVAAMQRRLDYANGYSTYDSGTPSVSGRVGLRKSWSLGTAELGTDLFLRGESGVAFRNDAGTITAQSTGWTTLNLTTDMRFNNGLTLVAEFQNLTDRSFQPYSQMPGAERSVNLFVTKSF